MTANTSMLRSGKTKADTHACAQTHAHVLIYVNSPWWMIQDQAPRYRSVRSMLVASAYLEAPTSAAPAVMRVMPK